MSQAIESVTSVNWHFYEFIASEPDCSVCVETSISPVTREQWNELIPNNSLDWLRLACCSFSCGSKRTRNKCSNTYFNVGISSRQDWSVCKSKE